MPLLGLQMGLASVRSMIASTEEQALRTIQSIPNYLATFDSRVSGSVLTTTGPDVAATAGQTVARWNSVDNASVYFAQSNAGIRPTLSANGGVGNTTSGQILVGTGFTGSTNARTVIIVYRNADAVSTAALCGSPGTTFQVYAVNDGVVRIRSGFGGGSTVQDRRSCQAIDTITLARRSGDVMTAITGVDRTFSPDSVSTQTSQAGLDLFSSNSAGSGTVKAHIVGLVAIDRAVSNDEAQVIMDAAMLHFGVNTPQGTAALYDIWGQSNADGWASTSGITAFDGINPERCFLLNNTTLAKYDFGVNQNTGGGGTTSQFGAESELLRLAERPTSIAATCKYSQTGTSLAVDWNPTTPGALYTAAMARAADARNILKSRGLQVQSRGLIWAQGEKDASTATATSGATYESLLTTLIANYRAAFGANLPVVLVKIKITQAFYTNMAVIQAAQAAVAANVPNVTLIDTASDANFPLFDGLHFGPTAQINIGAAAYDYFNP